jgi:hypothetical protein
LRIHHPGCAHFCNGYAFGADAVFFHPGGTGDVRQSAQCGLRAAMLRQKPIERLNTNAA